MVAETLLGKYRMKLIMLGAFAGLTIGAGTSAQAQVFDWNFEIGDQIHAGTIPVPSLVDDSGGPLASFLAARTNPTVKIRHPLSSMTAAEFFDGPTPLKNVFGALSNPGVGGDAITALQIENLVFQTNGTASSGASIGQYALDAYHADATNPSPSSGLTDAAYHFSGVNIGMPNLFSGSPTFRSPSGAGSTAPNIKSSLFTLPLIRLSEAAKVAPSGHDIVPFVSRFNSLGSPLVNSEFNGLPAWETTNQLLSRGDFQALVTHYRMRGADGVIAHDGGVVGYTHEQFLDDTVAGWGFLDQTYVGSVSEINLESDNFETGGFAWSGVFGGIASGETIATLLLSNLDDVDTSIVLPIQFDGFDVAPFDPLERFVTAGSHKILTFLLDIDTWVLLDSGVAFEVPGDNNGGIGIGAPLLGEFVAPIPLPASVWMLTGALALIARRIRKPE